VCHLRCAGAVKSIKPSDKHHHHTSPLAPAAASAAAAAEGTPPAAGMSTSETAGAAAAVSALRLTDPGCEHQQAADVADSADLLPTAAAAAAGGVPGGGSSSSAQDVQQLKQLLAEREAELAALRQQLQQLAPST
jgi:hypothetical protein